MARPTKYTNILSDKICELIATTSLSTKSICEVCDIDYATVKRWIADEKHTFCAKYVRAKEKQIEHLAEEILDISDDGSNDLMRLTKANGEEYEAENKEVTSRSKLRVDSRKWLLSKLKPKKYGDKLELSGDGQNPIVHAVLTADEIKQISQNLEAKV